MTARSWLLIVPMRPTLANAVHGWHYRKASADRKLWRADVLNPGAAPSPTDDRYTRLPKWAQMEMEAMRGEVDYLSARALQNTAGRP